MKLFLPIVLAVSLGIGFPGITRLQAADTLGLDSNETLFCVIAAINAAGYDEGINLPDNNPLRKQVRDYLASRSIPVLPEMKTYYRRHMGHNGLEDLSEYVSFALSVSGPPDFAWKGRDVDVPPDAMGLTGFQPLMIDFYRQADLETLWKQVRPAFDNELAKYHSPILNMTEQIDAYLRVPTTGYLGRHFEVFLDLLAAPQLVQTRSYGDDMFVVITPSDQPRMYDIRHAYLHFQIDPIVIKYGIDLDPKRPLIDFAQSAPLDDNFKNDFVLLANESLIRAVEARLDKDTAAVDRATRQGYILTPFFAEQLPRFENQEQGMRFYAEDMINAISLEKETARLSTVKFDSKTEQRVAKSVVLAPPPLSAAGQLLDKAENQYSAHDYNGAKDLFLKATDLKGSDAEHAQAWYGLGRVALRANQAETAVKLFEKTLESSPDDFTRCWTNVYLARLSRAQGDADSAKKYYEDALKVAGASDQARQAASKELQEISTNQENK